MIFGQSGTLKSFAAIDIGLSVATGSEWHGNIVGQGAVFYICGEGQKGIARRLRAWEIHHNICIDNAPFFLSDRPAQFLNEESAMEVVAAVDNLSDKHGKPALVIIDTLNRNFGNGNENDTSDMTGFVRNLDEYLRLQYGCSVLIIHHTGLTNKDRARGAYALHAALDWEYRADRQGKIFKLTNDKSKDYEQLPPLHLEAEIITLDCKEEDGKPMTSIILRSTTETFKKKGPLNGKNKIAYASLVEGIKENGGNPLSLETWREAAYQAQITTSQKPDTRLKTFGRAKKDLQEMGLIDTKDDFWWPIPDTGHVADI